MSYSERAHSLLRQGYTAEQAYALVAAERKAAELELSMYCPPSEQRVDAIEEEGLADCALEGMGQLNAFGGEVAA